MTDRRRINGPAGGTIPVTYAHSVTQQRSAKVARVRKPNELRKIFLQTGLIPSASGSAYLELESDASARQFFPSNSTIKLSCSVHGPKPLPRNAAFSPNLQLSASIKFAPFATHLRKGYVPDSTEKDLSMHLENALKGIILPDRWPKSAIEVCITVLEAESVVGDVLQGHSAAALGSLGMMNVLAGAINVAAAALVDAGIDCVDVLAGGVTTALETSSGQMKYVLDPSPTEHETVQAACLVGYLPCRDEITDIWHYGSSSNTTRDESQIFEDLLNHAIMAAKGAQTVIKEVVYESASQNLIPAQSTMKAKDKAVENDINDVEMKT